MARVSEVYSNKLALFIEGYRPSYVPLSTQQAIHLATLANYFIVYQNPRLTDDKITILHPECKCGLDGDFYITWTVEAKGTNLIFSPHFSSAFISRNVDLAREMEDRLTTFLPVIGYKNQITVNLPEPVVRLHSKLKADAFGVITILFESEFKSEFSDLYQYLKKIFES